MKDKRRFSQVTLCLHSLNFKHNIYDIWRDVSAGRGNVDRVTNELIWFPAEAAAINLKTAYSRVQRPRSFLVSTKYRGFWEGRPTPEVRDSRTSRHSAHAQSQVWQIWLVQVSVYCVYKAIQTRNDVGPGQRSRFLVLNKRRTASGILGDPGATSRDDEIFSGESLLQELKSPWELPLIGQKNIFLPNQWWGLAG